MIGGVTTSAAGGVSTVIVSVGAVTVGVSDDGVSTTGAGSIGGRGTTDDSTPGADPAEPPPPKSGVVGGGTTESGCGVGSTTGGVVEDVSTTGIMYELVGVLVATTAESPEPVCTEGT